MKYLCLAYGNADAWNGLTGDERAALLAQDEQLRRRGDLVAAVEPSSTVVRAWDGKPQTTDGPFGASFLPLAGFSVIEAASLEEAVRLVSQTPCARARGAVEVRPIASGNGASLPRPL
jgi:hypothetical protein